MDGNGGTSGQHGPKPKGGKFRQDDDQPRPSDRMRQEEPDGGNRRTDRKQDEKTSDDKSRKFQKAQEKADRAGEKLHTAREKLDKAQARQAAKKPPGLARKAIRGARAEAWFYVHNKIHQVEQENVGVEGAHKSELAAEGATRRLTRYAKRRYREHPARRVAKWERKERNARANLDFQKMAAEHPELASSPLSRIQQKWKLKRKYAKEAKAAARQSAKTAKKAASATGSAAKRAGQFAARHPAGVLLLLLLFVVFAVFASASSLFTTIGGGLSNAVSGTSYASEDDDLLGADEDYFAMERELSQTVANIENDHPGYDEYRYSVDGIGHNPYELASYLSAKYHVYTREQVQADLREIFEAQYELTLTEEVEIRCRTETSTDPETGETTSEEVPYEYYILNVTLTNRTFPAAILPRLNEQQKEIYTIMQELRGINRTCGKGFTPRAEPRAPLMRYPAKPCPTRPLRR